MKRHYIGMVTLCLAVASVAGAVAMMILATTTHTADDKFSLFILGATFFLLATVLGAVGSALHMTKFERNYTRYVRKELNDV